MLTYKEFLTVGEIISEEQFNEIIQYLPEIDCSNIILDTEDLTFVDSMCKTFIEEYLFKFENVYVDEINYSLKQIKIEDCSYMKDLIEIYNTLTKLGWNFVNYEDLKKSIEEEGIDDKKSDLISEIETKLRSASLEELEKIYSEL